MTANSTPPNRLVPDGQAGWITGQGWPKSESFDAVLAEMRRGGGTETGWIGIDTARNWADRLQSAHARELAEQQAIHAAEVQRLRTDLHDMIDANIYAVARADAAMGLLNTAVDVIEEGLSDRQSYDYRPRAESCARSIKEALAGGERK